MKSMARGRPAGELSSRLRVRGRTAIGLILLFAGVVSVSAPTRAGDQPARFRLGYVPIAGVKPADDSFQPLSQYLSREMGLSVQLVPRGNYLALIQGLKNQSLEAALLGPNAYVEAAAVVEIEPAAMEVYYPGYRGYQSIIISRAGSEVRRVEDGRGKVLAFTDPDSTSGFLVPMLHFVRDLGVAPASFAGRVVFAGSHGAVVKGVHEGRYALGATNDVDMARALAELKLPAGDFQVLWTSPMIPGAPYCLRHDLPANLKADFRRALLNLKDPALLTRMKVVGLSPVQDSDYNIIRELRKFQQ